MGWFLLREKAMNIDEHLLQQVKHIDHHVNRFPDTDTGNTQLLTTIYDYMEPFKQIMDSTSSEQMSYLIHNYTGFYRLAKVIEQMAEGLSSGTIQVPKDH